MPGRACIATLRQQSIAHAALELAPEFINPPLLDQKRQSGAVAGLARTVVAKHQRDVTAQAGGIFGAAEDAEWGGRPQPARSDFPADRDVETLHLVAADDLDRRRQRQVLRFAVRAVFRAAGNRDVELPRKIGERLVPQERIIELAHDA